MYRERECDIVKFKFNLFLLFLWTGAVGWRRADVDARWTRRLLWSAVWRTRRSDGRNKVKSSERRSAGKLLSPEILAPKFEILRLRNRFKMVMVLPWPFGISNGKFSSQNVYGRFVRIIKIWQVDTSGKFPVCKNEHLNSLLCLCRGNPADINWEQLVRCSRVPRSNQTHCKRDPMYMIILYLHRLVGDVLLATAFLSYSGPFNQEYRGLLNRNWMKELKSRKIPFTANLNLIEMLTDPTQVTHLIFEAFVHT